ncbi:hypothetical protein KRR39_21780 [Nocardioides panacis]|uniref:Uncharacterized protein n=1 Tax=Nocardioides panacis TaxID=2849501 RepID=A0A975SY10_9ACTN|nr:hypothetical protein [Nocardioides panacis]QWZ07961.1 hypothetical protein KRR39_21780 [Nocardioides panacis]
MARDDDEDTSWTRQLLLGVGALVAVALVIGGVVSVIALGAARVTGLSDDRPTATAPASLYIPSDEPTTTPEALPDPEGSASASPSPGTASPTKKPKKRKAITLQASPQQVPANERINLTGAYPRSDGASLQVQRFEGSWVDFPVTASVRGGSFATFVYTGRSGPNRFRVVDKASGRTSNPVRVVVG